MSSREEEGRRVAAALRDAGIPVESVFDLVNSRVPYPAAIPVLLQLLRDGVADRWIAQGVVRALSVKEARGIAAPQLLDLFEQTAPGEEGLKWAIGNALFVVATRAELDRILRLVQDGRHGKARQMLVATLGRIKTREAVQALLTLVEDPDVAVHAISALGKYQGAAVREVVERFTNDPDPLLRKTAVSTLRKLS